MSDPENQFRGAQVIYDRRLSTSLGSILNPPQVVVIAVIVVDSSNNNKIYSY